MTGARGDDDWLDLADAVGLLRDQVLEARRRAGASEVRFEIDNVTVEFELELARSRSAGGSSASAWWASTARGRRPGGGPTGCR